MLFLINACKTKDIEKAKELIRKGYDLEERDSFGRTPLLIAAEKLHMEMMKMLIENGANIHAIDNDGENILFYFTIDEDAAEFIDYFLDLGCDPEIRDNSNFNLIDDILIMNENEVNLQKKLLQPLFKRIDTFSEEFQKQLRAVRLELLF